MIPSFSLPYSFLKFVMENFKIYNSTETGIINAESHLQGKRQREQQPSAHPADPPFALFLSIPKANPSQHLILSVSASGWQVLTPKWVTELTFAVRTELSFQWINRTESINVHRV